MSSHGFLPSILQPTRVTEFSSTLIDNIFTNNTDQLSISGNILISFADHFTQFISTNKNMDKKLKNNIYQHCYKNFDPKSFIDDVSIQQWNCFHLNDTNEKFGDFVWRLEGCVERHAPLKKLSKKQAEKKSKPWINDQILKLIKHRDKLFHKKKTDPSDDNIKHLYKLFRNRTTKELKKAKKIYYNTYFENNLNNMKKNLDRYQRNNQYKK